jgi:hypothetical protein
MADLAVPIGCASIRLWSSHASEYMPIPLRKSGKGWHKFWFYLKNDDAAPLPIFSGCSIKEALDIWRYRPIATTQRKLGDLLWAIETLKVTGLRGASVIEAYHVRSLAPLMACKLRMWEMTPDSASEGTVMIFGESITPDEVEDCLDDTLDRPTGQTTNLIIVYLVPGHPPMHLYAGFIELVSCIIVSFPTDPIPDLIVVVCNPVFTSGSLIRCYRRMKNRVVGEAAKAKRTRRQRGSGRGCWSSRAMMTRMLKTMTIRMTTRRQGGVLEMLSCPRSMKRRR